MAKTKNLLFALLTILFFVSSVILNGCSSGNFSMEVPACTQIEVPLGAEIIKVDLCGVYYISRVDGKTTITFVPYKK